MRQRRRNQQRGGDSPSGGFEAPDGGHVSRRTGRSWWRARRGPLRPLGERERTLWNRLLLLRIAAVVTMAAVGEVSGLPWRDTLLTVALLLPYTAWLWLRFRRSGHLSVLMAFGDQVLAAPFILNTPETYPMAILTVTTTAAFVAAAFGRRVATFAILSGLVANGSVSLLVQPHGWVPLYLLHVVAIVVMVLLVGTVADSERQRTDRYEALLDGIDAIVWEGPEDDDRPLFVNENGRALLGLHEADVLTRAGWLERVHPDDVAVAQRAGVSEVEYRLRRADGGYSDVSERVRATREGRRGVLVDVTARRQAEEVASRFAKVLDSLPLALYVLVARDGGSHGIELQVEAANPAGLRLAGRPASEVVGQLAVNLMPAGIRGLDLRDVADVLGSDRTQVFDEMELPDRPGERFRVHVFGMAENRLAVSVEDITATARAAADLRHQALHDGLTQLPNRTLLADRIDQALAAAYRDSRRAALLLMDLDQFKEVNDALGHHQGDHLLVSVAERLRATLRDCDTIARLGGDEFAVLLRDATPSAATAVARRIVDALADPFDLDGIAFRAGVSIGIALYPDHATDAATLTRRADVAMYQAKRNGTHLRLYAPDDDVSSVVRLTRLSELRDAVARGELVVHYQPVVNLRTGVVERVEALVRWQHPRLGLLLPGEFIELAELSGEIGALTRWVLAAAATDCGRWQRDGRRVGVGVNLSVRNLQDRSLVGTVTDVIRAAGLPPGAMALEITESAVMDDPLAARMMIDELKAHLVSVAIDDFGTGHSSLAYLRDLAIDEIKIDSGFVTDLGSSDRNRTIVRAIIELGHNLDLTVTAEGAEDDATLGWLRTLDCDRVQGFGLGHPMPVPELLAWLDRHAAQVPSAANAAPAGAVGEGAAR